MESLSQARQEHQAIRNRLLGRSVLKLRYFLDSGVLTEGGGPVLQLTHEVKSISEYE
jgi:hypothetical protein